MNDSDATRLILDRARAAVLSRDYTLATRLYKTMLRDNPSDITLLSELGTIYQKSGNDADAVPPLGGEVRPFGRLYEGVEHRGLPRAPRTDQIQ